MTSIPRYPFVALETTGDAVDALSGLLFELGATGVEERDNETLLKATKSGGITLVASFDSFDMAEEARSELEQYEAVSNVRIEEVVGDAWRDAWKEHFAPFALTRSITVVPPWVRYERRATEQVLELEPGRAFGTGLHASTSLVSEFLEDESGVIRDKAVLDVGTGSGILSFVALLLGAARALAIDIDPEVVDVVRENAERNGLQDRIEVRATTVDTIPGTYDVVLANIEARILKPIASDIVSKVAQGGLLILSGILETEHDDLVRLYTSLPLGLSYTGTKRKGDAGGEAWVALAFRRS